MTYADAHIPAILRRLLRIPDGPVPEDLPSDWAEAEAERALGACRGVRCTSRQALLLQV